MLAWMYLLNHWVPGDEGECTLVSSRLTKKCRNMENEEDCFYCKADRTLDALLDAFTILEVPGDGTRKIEWVSVGEEIDEILNILMDKNNEGKNLNWSKFAKVMRTFLLELAALEADANLCEILHGETSENKPMFEEIMMLGFRKGKLYHTLQTSKQLIALKLKEHSNIELARSVLVKSTTNKKPPLGQNRVSHKGFNFDVRWSIYNPDSFPQKIFTVELAHTKTIIFDPLMSGWTERLLLDNPGKALTFAANLGMKIGVSMTWDTQRNEADPRYFNESFWRNFVDPNQENEEDGFRPEPFRTLALNKKRKLRQLYLN